MIFAIGNPVYDYIKTPFITTGERVLSGCSTNGCLALTRLGHATSLVGRVGDDYAERLRDDLARYGIVPHITRCAETGGFSLIYDQRGDRTLDVLGIAAPIEQLPAACPTAEAIIIGPILQETPLTLIRQLRAATAAPLLLDPQGLLREIAADGRIVHALPATFGEIAPLCDVIKANELEAKIITGIDPRVDRFAAARELKALGCKIAIVTLAEAGSVIDDGTQQYNIPAFATIARDPTGAGDTYLAGFLHAFLDNPADVYTAGLYGAATASIWIEHTGPDAPITLAEVERRVGSLRRGARD